MSSTSGNIKLSLILPCYNEIEHIAESFKKISEYTDYLFGSVGYEIILVDDGSVDGTRDYLRSLKQGPSLQIVFNESNLGRGGAVKRGLRLARGSVCGFMDIDCEVAESYIPKFVQQIDRGGDLVVGGRYYNVDFALGSMSRHLASATYRKLVELCFGRSPVDSESGYKFFSRRACDAVLNLSRFDNWFWDTEAVLICEMAGLRLVEVPVLFLRNREKTSTVRLFRDTRLYIQAVRQYRALVASGAYRMSREPELEKTEVAGL